MEHFIIEGGKPLIGSIDVQGAKNSALPILAATVLAPGTHIIHRVPHLKDIEAMCQILESIGASYTFDDHTVTITTTNVDIHTIPDELMSQIRSSIFLMGPMIGRLKKVSVTRPGGCNIGQRPIDLHLSGLAQLGVQIEEIGEMINCSTDELIGAEIVLPFPSVGATENIMMTAVYAKGITTIRNAAREPEIEDLANFLNAMGAQIEGAGTSEIRIYGVIEPLKAIEYQVLSDRIVAGTWAIASAMTQGDLLLQNVVPSHFQSLLQLLEQMGVEVECRETSCRIRTMGPLEVHHLEVSTEPYPGFPTDLQPQLLSLLSMTKGQSWLTENIFESRFKHVAELQKMGADLSINQRTVSIQGVSRLHAARVEGTDLRAGAALVLAALAADGISVVHGLHQIDRGYEKIEHTLTTLGAYINREQEVNVYTRNTEDE